MNGFRLKFIWSLFLRVQLTICQHPLSGPMVDRLPRHICVSRPQWVTDLLDLPTHFSSLVNKISTEVMQSGVIHDNNMMKLVHVLSPSPSMAPLHIRQIWSCHLKRQYALLLNPYFSQEANSIAENINRCIANGTMRWNWCILFLLMRPFVNYGDPRMK